MELYLPRLPHPTMQKQVAMCSGYREMGRRFRIVRCLAPHDDLKEGGTVTR